MKIQQIIEKVFNEADTEITWQGCKETVKYDFNKWGTSFSLKRHGSDMQVSQSGKAVGVLWKQGENFRTGGPKGREFSKLKDVLKFMLKVK